MAKKESIFKDLKKVAELLADEVQLEKSLREKGKKQAKAIRDQIAESKDKQDKYARALKGEDVDEEQPDLGGDDEE